MEPQDHKAIFEESDKSVEGKKECCESVSTDFSHIFLRASVVLAVFFLISPLVLKCPCIYNAIDSFLDHLKYTEYKEAYIAACGGMLGSFLAITGALWVERRLAKDNLERENEKLKVDNEKIALILYYDLDMFYKEISPSAINIKSILSESSENNHGGKKAELENYTGVYIHPEWISLVASLKSVMTKEEISLLYYFYGRISDVKRLMRKDVLQIGDMKEIEKKLNLVGSIVDNRYVPNKTYSEMINRLKQIANI